MEIINLKSNDSPESNLKKITDIKQAVRNENRVNIFVDNEYSFSLDISQLVDFKLKIGTELSDEELEKYKKASAFGKLYQRTLEWVLTRPRSKKETRDHLVQKNRQKEKSLQLEDEILEQVLLRLIEKGYVDDQKFAEYYVENRFINKGISKKRMRMELAKKGVDSNIVEKVLTDGSRNDEEEIKKIIAKKRRKYDDEKLINYLLRQGFDFELVRNLVQSLSDEMD